MIIPDLLSPIIAYRTWSWEPGTLTSLNDEEWIPGEAMKAICKVGPYMSVKPPHPDDAGLPVEKCVCGIYAAKNFDHLVKIGYSELGVHGEVYLWGKVIDHTLGYRAEFAYPKSFFVPEAVFPWKVEVIQSRLEMLMLYGVDIYSCEQHNSNAGATLLYSKQRGFQRDGLRDLVTKRAKWYEERVEKDKLKPGDRIHIKGVGIGVVHEIYISRGHRAEQPREEALVHFAGRSRAHLAVQHIKWDDDNYRWVYTRAIAWRQLLQHRYAARQARLSQTGS